MTYAGGNTPTLFFKKMQQAHHRSGWRTCCVMIVSRDVLLTIPNYSE